MKIFNFFSRKKPKTSTIIIFDEKDKKVRFYCQNNGKRYKLFSYFIQKDLSIGLYNYFKANTSMGLRVGRDHLAIKKTGNKIFSVNTAYARDNLSDFLEQKTSLHKSGTIVVKDKNNMRANEEKDSKFIPFNLIKDPQQICHIVFSYFKEYKEADNKIANTVLVDQLDILPMVCKIFLSPKNINFLNSPLRSVQVESFIYKDEKSLYKFDLDIYIVFLKSLDNFIPKLHTTAWTALLNENILKVNISKSVERVFELTINPDFTPQWIDFVQEEKAEYPIKVGTIYKNTSKVGVTNEYIVSDFVELKFFELKSLNSPYVVRYTYERISENETELTYHEWMNEGELTEPFKMRYLEKLKKIIEEK